jgi:small multidrug resistance pump
MVNRELIGVAMPYVFLAGAILAEVLGTTAMKASEGFSRVWPAVGTVVGYLVSFALLAQTLKTIQVGTAYAIWSAVGTALICGIGIVFFNESASLIRMVGIAMIIGGVVLLNISGSGAH